MTPRNIDLLVLTKRYEMNQPELDLEIERLADFFYKVESSSAICLANEIIDINRLSVIKRPGKVRKALRCPQLKPFVFICNKN
jgi:hypothetical protein